MHVITYIMMILSSHSHNAILQFAGHATGFIFFCFFFFRPHCCQLKTRSSMWICNINYLISPANSVWTLMLISPCLSNPTFSNFAPFFSVEHDKSISGNHLHSFLHLFDLVWNQYLVENSVLTCWNFNKMADILQITIWIIQRFEFGLKFNWNVFQNPVSQLWFR